MLVISPSDSNMWTTRVLSWLGIDPIPVIDSSFFCPKGRQDTKANLSAYHKNIKNAGCHPAYQTDFTSTIRLSETLWTCRQSRAKSSPTLTLRDLRSYGASNARASSMSPARASPTETSFSVLQARHCLLKVYYVGLNTSRGVSLTKRIYYSLWLATTMLKCQLYICMRLL